MPRKKKQTAPADDDFLPEEAREPVAATPTVPAEKSSRHITIRKAKIVRDLFLEGEYTIELPDHAENTSKFTCTVPVHKDLKAAYKKLVPHMAVLCSQSLPEGFQVDPQSYFDGQLELTGFGVRSFTIGGSAESEGVTLSGWLDGEFGMVNLNTPFTRYENEEYLWISELAQAIQMCIYEVEQYLFEGKRAPDQQLEIQFPEDDEEDGFPSMADPQQAVRDLHAAAKAGEED